MSSSNFPHYDINPNTGEPLGLNTSHTVAEQVIYHDDERPSGLVLPVIPT